MSKVYERVGSRSVEEIVARSIPAQAGVRDEVMRRALVAEAILTSHRYSGDSQIRIEHGDGENDIDWYVVLDDSRGLKAAMTIEFGRRAYRIGARKRGENEYGKDKRGADVLPMKAIRPLGIAFGLDERERF